MGRLVQKTWPDNTSIETYSYSLQVGGTLHRQLAHCQPVAIGGGQRQVAALNLNQHTGQDGASLVGGGRHLGLLDGGRATHEKTSQRQWEVAFQPNRK